jgi:hypothetical protein
MLLRSYDIFENIPTGVKLQASYGGGGGKYKSVTEAFALLGIRCGAYSRFCKISYF